MPTGFAVVAREECTTSGAEISPAPPWKAERLVVVVVVMVDEAEKRKRKTRREKRKPMTTLTRQNAAWRRSQKVGAGDLPEASAVESNGNGPLKLLLRRFR